MACARRSNFIIYYEIDDEEVKTVLRVLGKTYQPQELRAYTGPPLLIVRSGQPAVQAWAPEYTGM